MSDRDAFSDVNEGIAGDGIFKSSEALQKMGHVDKSFADHNTGLVLHCDCTRCGRPIDMHVAWPELVIIGQGAIPNGWYHDAQSGTARVDMRCNQCHEAPIPWGITPDEAQRDVKAGIQGAKLSPQQVHRWVAELQGGLRRPG